MANSNITYNMQALTNELNKLLDDDESYAQNVEQIQGNYFQYSPMDNDQRFSHVQPFLAENLKYCNIEDINSLATKDSSYLSFNPNFIPIKQHSPFNDCHLVMEQAGSLQFSQQQSPEIYRPLICHQSNNFTRNKEFSEMNQRPGSSKMYYKKMNRNYHRPNNFQSNRWDYKKQDKLQFNAKTMETKICLYSIRIGSKFENGNANLEILQQIRHLYTQVINLSIQRYEVLAYISQSSIPYGKLPLLTTRKIASNIEQTYRALLCENDSITSFLCGQQSLYDNDLWINVQILLIKFNDNINKFEAFRNYPPNILWKMYGNFGDLLTSLTDSVRTLSMSFFILKQRIREIPSPKLCRPRQRSVFIG